MPIADAETLTLWAECLTVKNNRIGWFKYQKKDPNFKFLCHRYTDTFGICVFDFWDLLDI